MLLCVNIFPVGTVWAMGDGMTVQGLWLRMCKTKIVTVHSLGSLKIKWRHARSIYHNAREGAQLPNELGRSDTILSPSDWQEGKYS